MPTHEEERRQQDEQQRWMAHQETLMERSMFAQHTDLDIHIIQQELADQPVFREAVERSHHPGQPGDGVDFAMPETAAIQAPAPPATVHESRRER